MADLKVLDELEEPQLRKRKSRKNTPEEKRKQNREWRKRIRQKKKAKEVGNDVPENNEKKPREQFAAEVVTVESKKEKRLVPSASTRRSGTQRQAYPFVCLHDYKLSRGTTLSFFKIGRDATHGTRRRRKCQIKADMSTDSSRKHFA